MGVPPWGMSECSAVSEQPVSTMSVIFLCASFALTSTCVSPASLKVRDCIAIVEREGFERCFSILIVKNVVILRLTKIKKKRSFVGWRVAAALGEKRENVLAVRPGSLWVYALPFFCRRLGDE